MRSTLVSLDAKSPTKSGVILAHKPSRVGTLCKRAALPRFSRVVGDPNAVTSYKLKKRAGHKCFAGESTKSEK